MNNLSPIEIKKAALTKSKDYLSKPEVLAKFSILLGGRAASFQQNLLQLASDENIGTCTPKSIFLASLSAAQTGLSLQPSLGYAYIVPFNSKKTGKVAQFQIGWKGLVQLAIRTDKYKTVGVREIYENQIKERNFITDEIEFNNVKGEVRVVGYFAYFKLLNGFEKTLFIDRESMQKHAQKYSKAYNAGFSVWNQGEDGFTSMANKTALKLLLGRFGVMSPELEVAIKSDQAIFDTKGNEFETEIEDVETIYADNEPEEDSEAVKRTVEFIRSSESTSKLEEIKKGISSDLWPQVEEEYTKRLSALIEIEDSKGQ